MSGEIRIRPQESATSLKLKAQQLAESGDAPAAETILRRVLDAHPSDAEALALMAIVDSDQGRHAPAVRLALRAAQLTRWQAPAIRDNLGLIIRRVSQAWERAKIVRKGFPILAGKRPERARTKAPREPFDVIVLCPGVPTATTRFENVFSLMPTGNGRVLRVSTAGTARATVREALARAQSDVLLFVNADDVPLEAFTQLVTALEESDAHDWAFGQAMSQDERASSAGSAYGQYRQLLGRLPRLPCPDFALFEQSDATGGAICIRRAALERIVDRLPGVPFSVRAVAIHAALESSPAALGSDVVARPGAGFDRDRAAAAGLLATACDRLLADGARNANAPMPKEWGLLAWALPIDQGVAQAVDGRHWERLVEAVASLERKFGAEGRERGGVNLVGMPLGIFGLAESMRAFVRAADLAGLTTCIADLGVNLKADESDFRLLERLRDRLPYRPSIVFANPDVLNKCWPAQLREPDRYRIGYWFWEFDVLPKEWSYAFELVDEIWVATEFVRSAVARSTGKPVTLMPHPIEVEVRRPLPRSAFGFDEDVFWFLVTFDYNSFVERKNPYAAIKAFRAAFPAGSEKVGLFIKTINGAIRPQKLAALRDAIGDDRRIVVRDQAMPRDEMVALLAAADCYLSLHRSEGLGLGLAESMYLGKPVIGTAYSGNLDFMTEQNSCLVRCSLVPVWPDQYVYAESNAFRWAEADIEHAAHCMRKVVADAHFRQSIADRARADIRSKFDPRLIGQMMAARLGRIGEA